MSLNVLSLGWFVALVAASVAVMFLSALVLQRKKTDQVIAGVQRKSRLFTVSERKFFECLSDALDYDFYIFAKVNVLDVVEAGSALSKRQCKLIEAELEGKRFDYVLCKKSDLSVSAVIELERFDRRVSRSQQKRHDALISGACKSASLRLFFFDVRQDYQSMDIRRLITGSSIAGKDALKASNQSVLSPAGMNHSHYSGSSMQSEHGGLNTCPKCHSDVVTKMAMKGKHIGERFLMCRKYPYCDYRMPIKGDKIVSMSSVQEQTVNEKPGFSDWAG